MKSFLYGLGTAFLTLFIAVFLYRLWSADLHIPLDLRGGDTLFNAALVKGMIDNGWIYYNQYLGMPSGQCLYDFPLLYFYTFQLLLIKLIVLFTQNAFVAMNAYYLLSFPLVAFCTFMLCREFELPNMISFSVSVIFTMLSYHFMRGECHLFLAAYYAVPLSVCLILWLCTGRIDFDSLWKSLNLKDFFKSRIFAALVFCCIISSCDIYYVYFTCYFLLFSCFVVFIRTMRFRNMVPPLVFLAVIILCLVVQSVPAFLYMYSNGLNSSLCVRNPDDSRTFGLQIVHLLIPSLFHVVEKFSDISSLFFKHSKGIEYFNNEICMVPLGIVASIGFVYSMIYGFVCIVRNGNNGMIKSLSALNLGAVLLSTVGGIGTAFAYLVSPQIRSLSRVSIFIALFSLLTLGFALKKWYEGKQSFRQKLPSVMILLLVTVLAIADQTPIFVGNFPQSYVNNFSSTEEFVKQIEKMMPDNAMIFQLPYIPFPESNHDYNLRMEDDYELMRGYLSSKKLRWSYGSIKNRECDVWQRTMCNMPPSKVVDNIIEAGFSGLYIDRLGYNDDAKAIALIEAISLHLKEQPVHSGNGRFFFFTLVKPGK